MGINNRGAVVGFSNTVEGLTRAFLYNGGSLVDLGTLGGDESFAYRINDNGVIVGRAQDASGRFHAFVTTLSGGAIKLSSLDARADGDYGAALGINSAGDVTGYYTTAGAHMSARNRVFLYRDFRVDGPRHLRRRRWRRRGSERPRQHGRVFQLRASRGLCAARLVPVYRRQARADRIARRQVDDGSRSEQPGRSRRRWGHGRRRASRLPLCSRHSCGISAPSPGGRQSAAYAINERGDIVGFSDGRDGSTRAIIVTAGVMRDLNGLITSDSGWVLTHARDINDCRSHCRRRLAERRAAGIPAHAVATRGRRGSPARGMRVSFRGFRNACPSVQDVDEAVIRSRGVGSRVSHPCTA